MIIHPTLLSLTNKFKYLALFGQIKDLVYAKLKDTAEDMPKMCNPVCQHFR